MVSSAAGNGVVTMSDGYTAAALDGKRANHVGHHALPVTGAPLTEKAWPSTRLSRALA